MVGKGGMGPGGVLEARGRDIRGGWAERGGLGPGLGPALHCIARCNAVAMHFLQYRATKVRLFQVFSWQPKHIKMETVPPELVLGWCTLTSQPGLLVLYIAFYIAIRLDDRGEVPPCYQAPMLR